MEAVVTVVGAVVEEMIEELANIPLLHTNNAAGSVCIRRPTARLRCAAGQLMHCLNPPPLSPLSPLPLSLHESPRKD